MTQPTTYPPVPNSPFPAQPNSWTAQVDPAAFTPDPVDDSDVVDLGVSDKPKRFRFDAGSPDIYTAPASIPVQMLQDFAGISNKIKNLENMSGEDGAETYRMLLKFFDGLLSPESAQLLRARIESREIGLTHILAVISHLLESYSARPTQPPSPSSALPGNGGSGNTSTPGAPNAA